ncbi:MAG: hypothetical protein WCG14_06985 [Chlamydiia bacterium]
MQSLHPYSPYPRPYNVDSRPDRTLQNTVIAVSKVALSILATLSAYLYLPTPLFLLTAVTCIIINIPAAQDQVVRFIHYPPPTARALSPRHLFTSPPTARRGESGTTASHAQVGRRASHPARDDINHGEESKTDQQFRSADPYSVGRTLTSIPEQAVGRPLYAPVGIRASAKAWHDPNGWEAIHTDRSVTSGWAMTDTPVRDPSSRVYHPAGHPQDAGQNTLGRPLHAQVGRRVSDHRGATSQEEQKAEEPEPFIQRQHSQVGSRE